jgi:hypothetical protein
MTLSTTGGPTWELGYMIIGNAVAAATAAASAAAAAGSKPIGN